MRRGSASSWVFAAITAVAWAWAFGPFDGLWRFVYRAVTVATVAPLFSGHLVARALHVLLPFSYAGGLGYGAGVPVPNALFFVLVAAVPVWLMVAQASPDGVAARADSMLLARCLSAWIVASAVLTAPLGGLSGLLFSYTPPGYSGPTLGELLPQFAANLLVATTYSGLWLLIASPRIAGWLAASDSTGTRRVMAVAATGALALAAIGVDAIVLGIDRAWAETAIVGRFLVALGLGVWLARRVVGSRMLHEAEADTDAVAGADSSE